MCKYMSVSEHYKCVSVFMRLYEHECLCLSKRLSLNMCECGSHGWKCMCELESHMCTWARMTECVSVHMSVWKHVSIKCECVSILMSVCKTMCVWIWIWMCASVCMSDVCIYECVCKLVSEWAWIFLSVGFCASVWCMFMYVCGWPHICFCSRLAGWCSQAILENLVLC